MTLISSGVRVKPRADLNYPGFHARLFERINCRVYWGYDGAGVELLGSIEQFYKPKRPHSALEYISPVELEM